MEFNITFFEACEALNRSKKSLGRYIRRGLLHPKEIKGAHGLEYRFDRADLDEFKKIYNIGMEEIKEAPERMVLLEPVTEEPAQPVPAETGQDAAMVPFLMDQIKVKDDQIKTMSGQMTEMIERQHETNILLHRANDRVLELEGKAH